MASKKAETEKILLKGVADLKKHFKKSKKSKNFRLGAILLVIVAVAFIFRSLVVVAFVNGSPITRISVLKELEKQGGKQILDQLITNKLIDQEAKRIGVSVTQTEIDEQIQKATESVEQQGLSLEDALSFQGVTMDAFRQSVEQQLRVEKLVTSEIEITDQEIADYFETNQQVYEPGSTLDDVKDQVQEQLRQEKIREAYTALVTRLQEEASIRYIVEY